MPSSPRLLIFGSCAFIYGAEKALLNLCSVLDGLYEITVFLPGDGPLAELLRKRGYRVKLHRLAVLSSPCSPARAAGYLLLSAFNTFYIMLYAVLGGYAGIVSNSLLLLPPLPAACLCGKKHIWMFREYSPFPFLNRLLAGLALVLPGRIICMSENIRKEMFGDRSPEAGDKVAVIREPLPYFPRLTEEDGMLRRELSIPRHTAVILLPSRIHPFKGQMEFLRDFSPVLKRHEVTVLLAGDCSLGTSKSLSYKSAIREVITKEGLQECVRMLGFRNDMDKLLALCDICVFPILRNEPFGLALQEALSAGKQVLYYPSPGLEEAASAFRGQGAVVLNGVSLETAIRSALPQRASVPPDYSREAAVSLGVYREGIRGIIALKACRL